MKFENWYYKYNIRYVYDWRNTACMLLSHLPFVLCLSNNLPLPPRAFFSCPLHLPARSPIPTGPSSTETRTGTGPGTKDWNNHQQISILQESRSRSNPIQLLLLWRNATPTPQARGNREYLTLCNRRHAQVTVGAILVPSSRLPLVRLLVRLVLVDWVLRLRLIQRR